MIKGVAKLMRTLDEFTGYAALYHLSTPIEQNRFTDVGEEKLLHEYVVVSKTMVPFSGPETYIFPADVSGEVVNWGELDGSRRGNYSHADVLREAGYEVVP